MRLRNSFKKISHLSPISCWWLKCFRNESNLKIACRFWMLRNELSSFLVLSITPYTSLSRDENSTEKTPEAQKRVQGLLTWFPNTYSLKKFLDHKHLKGNLWLWRDWHKIKQNVSWQGLAKEPSEAFQIVTVPYWSRHYHGKKLDEVFKPQYEFSFFIFHDWMSF